MQEDNPYIITFKCREENSAWQWKIEDLRFLQQKTLNNIEIWNF